MLQSTFKNPKTKLTPAIFWHAISILITKPHVLNKRLWGCKIWIRISCKPVNTSKWKLPAQFSRINCTVTAENAEDYINKVLRDADLEICSQEVAHFEVYFAQLYSKSFDKVQVFQLILLNEKHLTVTYHEVSQESNQKLCPNFPFTLKMEETSIRLTACCG